MNKTLLYILFAVSAVSLAYGDVTIRDGRARRHRDSGYTRTSYRHVPLSDPNDPFHDTYRRNTGRLNDAAEKRVTNLHAKVAAARAEADRRSAERRSPISTYSNLQGRTSSASVQERETLVIQRQVNIYNSSVVIN